jgi:hypothetical protein
MGRMHRDDEPEESTDVEQTEDDTEGHGKMHRQDEEAPDRDESEGESDEGDDDSEGHSARVHV